MWQSSTGSSENIKISGGNERKSNGAVAHRRWRNGVPYHGAFVCTPRFRFRARAGAAIFRALRRRAHRACVDRGFQHRLGGPLNISHRWFALRYAASRVLCVCASNICFHLFLCLTGWYSAACLRRRSDIAGMVAAAGELLIANGDRKKTVVVSSIGNAPSRRLTSGIAAKR